MSNSSFHKAIFCVSFLLLGSVSACKLLSHSRVDQVRNSQKESNGIRVKSIKLLDKVSFSAEGIYGFADEKWNIPLEKCDLQSPEAVMAGSGSGNALAFVDCSGALEQAVFNEWNLSVNKIPLMHHLPIPFYIKNAQRLPIYDYICYLSDVRVEAHSAILDSAKIFAVNFFDLVLGPAAVGKEFSLNQSYVSASNELKGGDILHQLRFLLVTGCHYAEHLDLFSQARLRLSFKIGSEVYLSPAKGSVIPLFPKALQKNFEWNVIDVEAREAKN